MNESRWYDKFAPFYDAGTLGDFFYREPRKAAIGRLNLSKGDRVADLFCGTGVDFPMLAAQVGDEGSVLAVDGSKGMLDRAKACAERCNGRTRFEFRLVNFSQVGGLKTLEDAIHKEAPRPIMDVYSGHLTLGARFINWVGAADCRRPVWSVLEEQCESFARREFRPFKVLDVSVVVASGRKP